MDWAKHVGRVLARLSEDATLTPANGDAAFALRVYFTDRPVELTGAGGPGVETSVPVAEAKFSEAPDVAFNDTLAIGTSEYRVVDFKIDRPSDTVMMQLELQE